MKNLTLNGRFMACLIIMCLFLAQSCRKDRLESVEPVPDLNKQLISEETILNWFATSPAAQFLTPDWTRAKQAYMNGRNVVRVPILNIDRVGRLAQVQGVNLSLLSGKGLETGIKDKKSDSQTAGINPNYNEKHPPELFFVESKGNAKLKTFLLNFIPTDKNKENGENNLWAGKLYEWNLTGDTLWVQEIEKGKLRERYGIKKGDNEDRGVISTNPHVKQAGKIASINDKEISVGAGFFKWLGDLIGDVIGWVAGVMGIPTHWDYGYNNTGGYRITWPANGGNSTTIDYIAGEEIYGSYGAGYYQGGNFVPFPSGPNISDYDNVWVNPAARYLFGALQLENSSEDLGIMDFLNENESISNQLMTYIVANGETQESRAFARWAAGYLKGNSDVVFEDLIRSDKATFIMDVATQLTYPKFTSLIKELRLFVKNDQKVLDALKLWSGFSENQILERLEFGKGPKIVVKDMVGRYGYFNNTENPKVVNINASWVRGLESANLLGTKQATGFLLAVTVLHEFVHQARAVNGLDSNYEYGIGFENSAFGLVIDKDNAGNYSYRFYGK